MPLSLQADVEIAGRPVGPLVEHHQRVEILPEERPAGDPLFPSVGGHCVMSLSAENYHVVFVGRLDSYPAVHVVVIRKDYSIPGKTAVFGAENDSGLGPRGLVSTA